MGVTFKENCPDVRNSKVMDIYNYLNKKIQLICLTLSQIQKNFFNLKKIVKKIKSNKYDGIIIV